MREAGINIWIDQLDVRFGDNWDDVTEEALDSCENLLVILSPVSVASKNVKDEIAFGLEEDKRIIPVLYKRCKVPLRIGRLQRSDFTENYASGLKKLLSELDAQPPVKRVEQPKSEVGVISPNLKRNQVFISYSHHDRSWLQQLQTMLKPLERNHKISVWDDTKSKSGAIWQKELTNALNSAKVAVLLVSPTYLASDFILNHELVHIFKAEKEEGLIIIWIPLSASMYEETALVNHHAVIDPSTPFDGLTQAKQKEKLVYIVNKIKEAIESK